MLKKKNPFETGSSQYHYDRARRKLFYNLLINLAYDNTIQLSTLEYFEYFSALPLAAYEKPLTSEEDMGDYFTPTSRRLAELLDYTPIWLGQIDISDLPHVLNFILDNVEFRHFVQLLQDVYDESHYKPEFKIHFENLLTSHVLNPITKYLCDVFPNGSNSMSWSSHKITPQEVFGKGYRMPYLFFSMTARLFVSKNHKPVLCGEVEMFPLFEGDATFEQLLQKEKFRQILDKLLATMITLSVSKGFISDSQNTVFIEIDCDMLRCNIDQIVNVPMRTYIVNNESSAPSILQMFMYFIYKSCNDPVDFKDVIKQCGYFKVKHREAEFPSGPILKQSMGIITLVLDPESFFQHFKVPAAVIKQFVDVHIADSEFVLLKIYDIDFPQYRKFTRENIEHRCDRDYFKEKKSIKILSRDRRFNNVYLYFGDEPITYDLGYGHYLTGRFILTRFLNREPLPKDWVTYRKLQDQVYVLRCHKITHGRLNEGNIIYCSDTETPYIIDFEVSSRGKEYDYHDDYGSLKYIFNVD